MLKEQTLQAIVADGYYSGKDVREMAQELLNLRPRTTTPSAAPPAPMVLDLSKPVQTRDGRKVTLISHNGRGNEPFIGYIEEGHTLNTWYKNGAWIEDRLGESLSDLVNSVEKAELTRYVNVYRNLSRTFSTGTFFTKASADEVGRTHQRFACVEVKISATEGEGL